MSKDLRDIYRDETGLSHEDQSQYVENGNYPISYEYAEWLENLIQNDLLGDIWYLLQCAKNKSELFKHEYDQYENKIKRLTGK